MEKGSVIKHVLIRISILIILTFISIFIGESTLNAERRCGTGDVLAYVPWFLGFYLLWSLSLFYEIFSLTKRKQKAKKNGNIIMIFLLPTIIILLWIYFEIINL